MNSIIQNEQSAEEAKAYLAAIIESSDDAIISKNLDGIITSWNASAEQVFGYTANEVIGKHITIIIPAERRNEENHIISKLKKGERISHFETVRQHKTGELLDISLTVSPIRDAKGKIIGASKIARDITLQKKAAEELVLARNAAEAANIAKTEFLANMSHEIRTPMNAVIGLAGILAQSKPLTDKQQEFIKTLQMSADSLLGLINDMLDVAKIEARTIELEEVSFNLTQMVAEIIQMIDVRLQEKNLKLFFDGKSTADRVFIGDVTRIRQIVTNLLSNAVKFTEKGSIYVSIASKSLENSLEEITVIVKDTGIGIPPDKLETIFQKFIQADTSINRKYGGTGLGLAITKTLAEIMGGTIEVESKLGEGSAFTLHIPLIVANESQMADYQKAFTHNYANSMEAPKGPRVLLVEDYAPNVMVATAYLEQFGYEWDVAHNGLEAIEKVKQKSYALVLMDVQMHGMNGLEATRAIRAYETENNLSCIPIAGMTAHALKGDKERCMEAGMDDYIAKPFNPSELENLLSKLTMSEEAAA